MAIGRRTWLLALSLMVGVLLALPGIELLTENERANAQVAERPNIVFIMTDDLDEQSMKQLPGIQQVMQDQGTTFKNAYVTYALCCPSRATFLRGQYPHNHGVIGLDTGGVPGGEQTFRELGRDQSTVATWLDDAGYQTKHIGKYMNGYGDLYKPPGWDEWFTLQGPPPTTQYTGASSVENTGKTVTMGGHSTDLYADQASDFIRRSSENPEPFFVVVDTLAPHGPPEVADRYQNHFTATPLPRPDNFDEEVVSDKPKWVQSYPRFSQDEINRIQDRYRWRLRSMLSVEDLLEQTITTLQQTGELENTYIFFTSDNGMHLGNHRLAQGKKTPYEEAIGVPLMVRGPGVPAREEREQLVINNDFAPTIAELAGVTTPQFVDGSSFAPLLTGSSPPSWRTAFLEEGWLDSGLPNIRTPDHKSVHTQTHMFTEYATGEYELYDLVLDPDQLESKPRAGNELLYSELQTRLDALRACSGTGCRDAEWATDTTTPPPEPPPPTTDRPGPPSVTSTDPGTNVTGVATTTNVTAFFSEEMMASSINGTTFKLTKKGSTTKIGAVVTYFPDDLATTDTVEARATLDPRDSLRSGVTYKAVVTTGAKDSVGNALAQQYRWFFTVS
jgi:arylsulfatase A-like enzyme